MNGQQKNINTPFGKSIHVQKHDKENPCKHQGLHYHHAYEIVYVDRGMGTIVAGDKEVDYQDGTLLFFGPSIPHFGFFNFMHNDNFEIVIHFDESFVKQKLFVFPELFPLIRFIDQSGKFMIFNSDTKHRMKNYFEKIADQSESQQLLTLFIILQKMEQSVGGKKLFNEIYGEHYARNSQTERIITYINKHYSQKISTRDIAGEIGLTTNSFCRIFKKITGESFVSYLNKYRILQASKMLVETDDNISTIMYKCGFENQSYFSKAFFQHQKLSPKEYRKKYRSSINE
jgi:AraC-like DNA-binding protein